MSQSDNTQYFDLHTTGLGYVSRIREVRPESGQAFLSLRSTPSSTAASPVARPRR